MTTAQWILTSVASLTTYCAVAGAVRVMLEHLGPFQDDADNDQDVFAALWPFILITVVPWKSAMWCVGGTHRSLVRLRESRKIPKATAKEVDP